MELTPRASMPSRFTPDQFLQTAGPRDRMRNPVLAAEVEVVQPVGAALVAGGDLVELVLHGGGEVVVHQSAEVLFEQARHSEGHPGRDQSAALLVHVAAILNGLMIEEYVEGRPIPSSSRALTNDASV